MPQVKLTQTFVQGITPTAKRQRFNDTAVKGLVIAVEPSGRKVWRVDYYRPNGKRTFHTIGAAELFTVAQAREVAKEFLAKIALGEDPTTKDPALLTFGELVDKHYAPWVAAHRRTGGYSLRILRNFFGQWFDAPAESLTLLEVERWRQKRSAKAATLNRQTAVLKAVLNWALKRDLISANPLARLERMQQTDSLEKVRYLSADERNRLMAALDEREERLRSERDSHNEYLKERGRELFPSLRDVTFADHLKPMILLSLNTGIRQGALFALRWSDIDFDNRVLTVRSETSKSGKVIRIPLNKTAYETLCRWETDSELVFPSPRGGGKMDNVKKGWAKVLKDAKIENFRWHDMRHDFASQLVMHGVDLNTVRELLGHADLKMTLRYAHLAPEAKIRAVQVLD